MIWQYNAKFKDGHKCQTPHLTEDCIKLHFLNAYNQLLVERFFIAEEYKAVMTYLTDTTANETEDTVLREELAVVDELLRQAIAQNASMVLNQEDYQQRYDSLAKRYEEAATRVVASFSSKNALLPSIKNADHRSHRRGHWIEARFLLRFYGDCGIFCSAEAKGRGAK